MRLGRLPVERLYNEKADKAVEGILKQLKTGKTFETLITEAADDIKSLTKIQTLVARLIRGTGAVSEEEWQSDPIYRDTSELDVQAALADRISLEVQMAGIEAGVFGKERREQVSTQAEILLKQTDISDAYRERLENFLKPQEEEVPQGVDDSDEDEVASDETVSAVDDETRATISSKEVDEALRTQTYLVGMGLESGSADTVDRSEGTMEPQPLDNAPELNDEARTGLSNEEFSRGLKERLRELRRPGEVDEDEFTARLDEAVAEAKAIPAAKVESKKSVGEDINLLEPVLKIKEQRKVVESYTPERERINRIYEAAADLRGGYNENIVTYMQAAGERACKGEGGENIRKLLGPDGAKRAMSRFFESLPNQMQRAIDVGEQGQESFFKASIKYAGRYLDRIGSHQEVFGWWGAAKAAIPSWVKWPKWLANKRREVDLNMLAVRERAIAAFEEAAQAAKRNGGPERFLQAHAEELRLAQLVEEPRWRAYIGPEGGYLEVRALDAQAAQEKLEVERTQVRVGMVGAKDMQAGRKYSVNKVEEVRKQKAGGKVGNFFRGFIRFFSGE